MSSWKVALLTGFIAFSCRAATLNLGYISFDALIPGAPGTPAVNDFSINNLTYDPSAGGFALPPDFPILSDVKLLNSYLTLLGPSGSTVIDLGDLGPGSFNPGSLVFPETSNFFSASFTATLSITTFLLADGSTFSASSPTATALLTPSTGTTLTTGVHFALIQVSDTPEPVSALLALVPLACCVLKLRR